MPRKLREVKTAPAIKPLSRRKQTIRRHADELADKKAAWIERNSYFHESDTNYLKFLVPTGRRVLELGCGTGQLLAAVSPAYGVGVDLSEKMVERARTNHPDLEFMVGDAEDPNLFKSLDGPFDVIIMSDTVGYLDDVQGTLENLHSVCTRDTRVIISYHSWLWQPLLKAAEAMGFKMPSDQMNWIGTQDTANFLELADFEPIKREWRQLLPKSAFGVGDLLNKTVAALPLIRRACVRNYLVARPLRDIGMKDPSCTVLVPCRNEEGNVENAITRMPDFCKDLEILYVEGHSQDDTLAEIHRVIAKYPDMDIKVLQQDGVGKGDAVRKGFAHARGDILMILDGDLTMPPEELPKFYDAITSGKGEYINGSRLVYPMEDEAMRFLNFLGNSFFSLVFSWLLNQRITDTLCGTKVLSRKHYDELIANRQYFGDFDPFGDFDLIFGTSKLNLKLMDVPITYAARTYGSTQISRFSHGWLLIKMVTFAFRKLKAI